MREGPGIILVPERYIENSARSRNLDIRSDHRLPATDRRPHRFAEHRVDAGTAMLHFASDTNDSAFAIRDGGSVEQLHQLWHQALPEHSTGLEQRSQILDELTGEWVANNRHSDSPRNWPTCLNAEFREHRFTQGDGLANLDHDLLPFKPRHRIDLGLRALEPFHHSINFNWPAWRTAKCHRAPRSTATRRHGKSPVLVSRRTDRQTFQRSEQCYRAALLTPRRSTSRIRGRSA